MARSQKLRVGVVFGGRSGEHEVSLMSAGSILANLDPEKYEVVPIGITKEGRWIVTGDPLRALKEGLAAAGPCRLVALLGDPAVAGKLVELPAGDAPPPSEAAPAEAGELSAESGPQRATGLRPAGPLPALDVVFPVLHGPYGEDGTIQGLLELAGIPYVGAGVLGSALGMDKVAMKDVLRTHGLPVLDYVLVKRSEWRAGPQAVVDRLTAALSFPMFVKPCNLGSSVGITKVHALGELAPAIDEAAQYDRRIIVEQGLEGAREIECSVLGNDRPEASVLGEIIPSREFYDYNAKYVDGTSGLIIPADLPAEAAEMIRDLAVRAFLALDGSGMARVDFLASREADLVYINELNTIPGFTKISMYPKLWEASGLPYPALLDRLIEFALERYRDRKENLTSYQPRD
ncbi:MAG: D-alanine--D-alanine ligase family protein [Bacillota bacterium]